MYERVPLTLTKSQFDKLSRGHPIQLSHAQLSSGRHWIALHPETAKKIMKARHAGKGARIQVGPHELEQSGDGLKEFLRGAKKAGQWLKKNVIDSKLYQESVRPLVRQAVDQGLAMASPYLGQAAPLLQKGAHALGKETGAFGINSKRVAARKPRGRQIMSHPECEVCAWDQSRLLGPQHPAMHPQSVNLPPIGGRLGVHHRAPAKKRAPASTRRVAHQMVAGSFLPA